MTPLHRLAAPRTLREPLPDLLDVLEFQAVMNEARRRDLNRDGVCDARSGVVNFWCTPDDKPDGWDAEITQGALDFPREYVGGVYFEWDDAGGDRRARTYVEAQPYGIARHLGSRDADTRVVPAEMFAACLRWVRAKWEELKAQADDDAHP